MKKCHWETRELLENPNLLKCSELQPALQKQLWDYLVEHVYRISTIVPLHYRVTQGYVYASGNPYCWFPGFCSYAGKTAWMTDKAPGRKSDKLAQ
jgi:hypothetical protein